MCQEGVLGIGGVRMLRALGYMDIARFHMNEGHASLLTLELLDEQVQRAGRTAFTHDDVEVVRQHCVFTTHTPVPAGHDQFPLALVERVLGPRTAFHTIEEVVSRVQTATQYTPSALPRGGGIAADSVVAVRNVGQSSHWRVISQCQR
jgi:glucan phosphorylase